MALRQQGRHEEAEACYRCAIDLDPDYTPAWLNLAIVLQKRGAVGEAQVAYQRALELDSEPAVGRRLSRKEGEQSSGSVPLPRWMPSTSPVAAVSFAA